MFTKVREWCSAAHLRFRKHENASLDRLAYGREERTPHLAAEEAITQLCGHYAGVCRLACCWPLIGTESV